MSSVVAYPFTVLYELIRVAILRRSRLEIFAFVALAAACLISSIGFDVIASTMSDTKDMFAEDGPVETVQAFFVGAAAVSFAIAALRMDFELFYGAAFAALLCGLMARREVPGCVDRFFDGGFCVTNAEKSWTLVVLISCFLGTLAYRRVPWAKRIRDLNFFWLVPIAFGSVLLGVAELAERLGSEACEETLELAAYVFTFSFSIALNFKPSWFDVRLKSDAG